jgi:hypothetical protein
MAEIGPLICSEGRSDVAINLLTAILNRLEGLQVSMCVPAKQGKILDMLKKSGIAESFTVARMFFGIRHAKDCICAAESLERG